MSRRASACSLLFNSEIAALVKDKKASPCPVDVIFSSCARVYKHLRLTGAWAGRNERASRMRDNSFLLFSWLKRLSAHFNKASIAVRIYIGTLKFAAPLIASARSGESPFGVLLNNPCMALPFRPLRVPQPHPISPQNWDEV